MMIKILTKVFTVVGQVVDFFHRLDESISNLYDKCYKSARGNESWWS